MLEICFHLIWNGANCIWLEQRWYTITCVKDSELNWMVSLKSKAFYEKLINNNPDRVKPFKVFTHQINRINMRMGEINTDAFLITQRSSVINIVDFYCQLPPYIARANKVDKCFLLTHKQQSHGFLGATSTVCLQFKSSQFKNQIHQNKESIMSL